MREVRVESLDKMESLGGEVWISANSDEGGAVSIVFPKTVWDEILAEAANPANPADSELEEWRNLKGCLVRFAEESSFEKILEGVPCGDSGRTYDLVLRSNDLYAVTTGYLFAPEIEHETVEEVRDALDGDDSVEQAYLIGAVAKDGAFALGDDDLKIVSVRGRKSTASRFEMAPELWRVLSENLRWANVETVISNDDKPNDKG